MFLWKGSPRARTQGVPSLLILIFLLALSGCGGGESIPDAQGSASILNASPSGFPLTVDIVGSGTVTSSSGGINCRGLGTPCNALYTGSASVTLLAAPAAEFDFQGWSGDGAGCGSNVSCTVAMSSARSVRATFSLKTYALTVGLSGSGTVTSAPAGINCGADCSEGYASGASVSLTAAPAAGFTFAGWSGSGVTCPGTGACSVSLTGARAVTATFSPIAASNFVLQVNLSGSGTVTSAPTGISCGADCSESYASGASVTLTAAPASGYTFSGWSGGGCSGTGACTVE